MRFLRRRRQAVRPIGEQQAYARLHGDRGGDVTLVKAEPRRPRYRLRTSGEKLRRSFEEKLDARRPPPAARRLTGRAAAPRQPEDAGTNLAGP